MPSDMPVHTPFTGEPGGAPEYAPSETPPEISPGQPEEAPPSEPFTPEGDPNQGRDDRAAAPGAFPQFAPD